MAQTQLTQAQASLHAVEAQFAYSQIRAPRDGTLISRYVERGSVVQPGKALMDLAPAGDTQIVVQIDEQNLGLLKVGQKANVSADAYPKENFEAKLIYVNPAVDPGRGTIEVKLTVASPPAYLRQDMTVSVEIEVAHRSQAVVVDAAVVRDISGKPWGMKLEDGRAKRISINLGAIGDKTVEIVSGLQPGDQLVRGNAALVDGQRIRGSGNE